MTDEASRDMTELSRAFDRANTSITRTGQAFGELAKSSQEWNIISRILSGTGMWRLQNQIRAVGNIINVYHKRQENAMKSTLEAVDANAKLAQSLAEVDKALGLSDAKIAKTPLAIMFTKAGRDGIKEYKAMWTEAGKQLGKAETGLAKALTPSNASKFLSGGFFKDPNTGEGGIGEFMRTGFNKSRTVRAGRAVGRFGSKIGKGIRNIGMSEAGLEMERIGEGSAFEALYKASSGRDNKRQRGLRAWASFKKKLGGISGKVAQFFVVGGAFLLKASLYFIAIITAFALLIFIIKKLEIKKRFKAFEKKFGYFGELFGEIKTILGAVFSMFKAAFEGDGAGLWKGFKLLIGTLLAMLETIVKIVLRGIFEIVKALPSLILRALKGIGGGIKNIIFGRANGGVVGSGELTLVGERGPELVRLPSGARVHSNAESRRMAGSNIHVHVNGRVGASDAEIRDIANKVAREINLKMNRTAHTTGRL